MRSFAATRSDPGVDIHFEGAIACAIVSQWLARNGAEGDDLPQKDAMVATGIDGHQAAFDMSDGAIENRRAGDAIGRCDCVSNADARRKGCTRACAP